MKLHRGFFVLILTGPLLWIGADAPAPAPEASPPQASAPASLPDMAKEARALEASKEIDKAAEVYRAMTEKFSQDSLAWFLNGRFLSEQTRDSEAIASFEKGLEITPDSETAHLYLARLYLRTGDSVKSSEHSRKVMELQKQWNVPVEGPSQAPAAAGETSK